jgi:hypothetical protein
MEEISMDFGKILMWAGLILMLLGALGHLFGVALGISALSVFMVGAVCRIVSAMMCELSS